MDELRKSLGWLFAFTSLVCVFISFSLVPGMLREHPPLTNLTLTWKLLILFLPWIMPFFAIVFGMAWWTSSKGKRSAGIWGILASLINVQAGVLPLLIPPHSVWNASWLILGLGIAGLVVFARRPAPLQMGTEVRPSGANLHDGTIDSLNKAAPLLLLIGGGAGFFWWERWIRTKDIFIPHSTPYLMLVSVVLGLFIVMLHELGHTLVGLMLGMRLRIFIAGPFEWRIRDGKWEFHFDLKRLLVESGATGVVPSGINFSRRSHVYVLMGGVLVNASTGVAALWTAFLGGPDAQVQTGGFLALFGAWSLTAVIVNLIPFRTPTGYSDGAQIYQILSNGAWADLHRVFAVAGSTLVTLLRPKDYDIEAILRAGRTINQGAQGLLLRLLAYSYYLDCGRNLEAARALSEAGVIYNESASDVSAEMIPAFVFGGAYLSRDANMTRSWWDRLEAKKPTRFNVDYWLANSALHWSEGRSQDANQSWDKAAALAQKLPQAGAYDFDRHCCSLLRRAMDEVPVSI